MGPYVPPGQSPPFQVVDDLHHGAWVIIAVALGLVFSIVSFLIRLYVRLALNPPFALDDFVLLGATIMATIQSSLLFGAVSRGFGTAIDLLSIDQVNTVQNLVVISDIFYLIVLYTTKCCVVGIYLRLTPQKAHNRASTATLVLCTLWVIPAIFVVAINCGFNRPWKGPGGRCPNLLARWQFIVSLDIATELILFILCVILLAGLFMPLKRKLTIASAFVFRLPMILFAIFHIRTIHKNIGSTDPTLAAVKPIIWAQVELHYALIACSVFCLRPFIAAVSTNYGTAGDSTLESTSHGTGNSNNNKSSSSSSRNRMSMPVAHTSKDMPRVPDMPQQSNLMTSKQRAAFHAKGTKVLLEPHHPSDIEMVDQIHRGDSVASDESTKMIIRKDVQYTVEFNGRSSDVSPQGEMEYWDRYLEAQH